MASIYIVENSPPREGGGSEYYLTKAEATQRFRKLVAEYRPVKNDWWCVELQHLKLRALSLAELALLFLQGQGGYAERIETVKKVESKVK